MAGVTLDGGALIGFERQNRRTLTHIKLAQQLDSNASGDEVSDDEDRPVALETKSAHDDPVAALAGLQSQNSELRRALEEAAAEAAQ